MVNRPRLWRCCKPSAIIRAMPFSPFDRDRLERKRARFRFIPVRTLLPNLITLLALCAGLTAIRLAVEDKLEWAVAAIVFAAMLDGVDEIGRASCRERV